ncbi:sortase domain-bontaining protein [Arthrobacter sp. SDTb3-6]|uniref:sortase domain-containing protein n=1 Tax=Arthrobacter sp. SDTb3-6 TaxID=2713571 RepID=UPI00159D3335|nr:sortase [Arthrobacter sp. SDTb3-6]NVM99579.1 class F sortase [Arthrobacter sp. SDTb3-6]
MNKHTSRRGRRTASAAAGVLLTGLLFGTAACAPQGAPAAAPAATMVASAPSAVSRAATGVSATASAARQPATTGPLLDASVPVRLDVPAVDIHTALVPLGQAADGSMDVPGGQPGDPGGWYKYSPTPGQLGPAVILGHVNNLASPQGLFFRLHEMKHGEQFTVTRADHTVAVFQVDKLAEVKKATFPTLAVYGNTNRAEIRLITCGGYDAATGVWTENTVVYGHLVSSHKA